MLPIQRLSEGFLRVARLPGRLVLADQDASVLGDLSPEMPEFPHMVATFSQTTQGLQQKGLCRPASFPHSVALQTSSDLV